MARSKAQMNSLALDPKREMLAVNMGSPLPGGPNNNNPEPVIQAAAQPTPGQSIYRDHDQTGVYPAMNGAILNPENTPVSQLPRTNPMGQKLNQGPYGMQLQPDINGNSPMADMMEASRYAMRADPMMPQSPMGLTGMPAIPGNIPDTPGFTEGPPLMPGSPAFMPQDPMMGAGNPGIMPGQPGMMTPGNGGMVPGSTPQKVGQKKKGGKK